MCGGFLTQEELKKILHTIYKNIRCPSCGKQYEFGRIHIKGYFNNLCFLELHCSDHLPLYATIAAPSRGPVEINTKSAIDDDYIINAYDSLSSHQGSISELLNK